MSLRLINGNDHACCWCVLLILLPDGVRGIDWKHILTPAITFRRNAWSKLFYNTFRGPFFWQFFRRDLNCRKISFSCNYKPGHHIVTNFCTAALSWHVHNFVAIILLKFELDSFFEFGLQWKKSSVQWVMTCYNGAVLLETFYLLYSLLFISANQWVFLDSRKVDHTFLPRKYEGNNQIFTYNDIGVSLNKKGRF